MINLRCVFVNGFSILVLMTSMLQTMNLLCAQSTESEVGRFVAPDTFLFCAFNVESIMQQVDGDDELIHKYRTREARQAVEFSEALRVVFALSSHLNDGEGSNLQMPATVYYLFDEITDHQGFITSTSGDFFEFQPETYGDYEFYQGVMPESDFQVPVSLPAAFFPSDSSAIIGDSLMIRDMIDGEDADSAGRQLVDQMDYEAEVHFVLQDGSKLSGLPMFQLITSSMELPDIDLNEMLNELIRLEIVIDSNQMTPVEVSIEMTTPEHAEEVENMLRQGLAAVPFLIDGAESELDWEDEEIQPIADSLKGLLKLGKAAAEQLELSRDGSRLDIQLDNIDGLDRLPHRAFSVIAHRQMVMEEIMKRQSEGPVAGFDIRDMDGDR